MTDVAACDPGRMQGALTDLHSEPEGWQTLLRSSHLPKLLLLCFAVWLHAANSLLAATTVPQAVSEMGGASLISWAFTLYLLGSILAGASAGLVSKRLGLRLSLMLSAGTYGLGSVVCATASLMEIVLLGRFLQGIGGGMLLALTYVALSRLFPSGLMPRVMALTSAAWSASACCGPLIGGSFATFGLWRLGYWAFAVQAAVFVVLAWKLIPAQTSENSGGSTGLAMVRLALLGSAIMAVALAAAHVDLILSPLLCLAGAGLVWAFLSLDRHHIAGRMFPSSTLDFGSVAGTGILMVFMAGGSTMSFLVYGPVLLETLFGLSPLLSGYVIAIEAVAWGASAIVFSGSTEASEKSLIRSGTAIVSLGVVGLAAAMPSENLPAVVLCAAAQGAGFGMMWAFVVRRLVSSVPAEEKDTMASAIPATQQVAFALGAAVAGIAANAVGFADGVSGEAASAAAFWVFAVFLPPVLVANWAAWKLTGQRHHGRAAS